MTTFLLGSNRIEDCGAVLVIGGESVFDIGVAEAGLLLTFRLLSPPASTSIRVENNSVVEGPVALEQPSALIVSLTYEARTLIHATRADDAFHVALDLRPVGINVYSTQTTLHVGGAVLSGNTIRHCAGAAVNVT